jgi:DNA (cytosine-5)-methyltransferase 1
VVNTAKANIIALAEASGPERAPPRVDKRAFSVVDLFCGAGGLSEGFQQAGFEVLAGTDYDPDALATYAANFPNAEVILGDIRAADVKARALSAARSAAVLVGGPPCQAFSQVRNHTRVIDDPRNALYREFVETLRAALPQAFVMENVTGMDQMGVRDQILADLALDGEYNVLAQIVDAADFGVPQTRKRLLFIGVRRGMSPPVLAGSGATESIAITRVTGAACHRYQLTIQRRLLSLRLVESLRDPESLTVVSATQAISDLAALPVGNRLDEMQWEELPGPSSAYQRLMRVGARNILANVQVPRINKDTELRLKGIPQRRQPS